MWAQGGGRWGLDAKLKAQLRNSAVRGWSTVGAAGPLQFSSTLGEELPPSPRLGRRSQPAARRAGALGC